MPMRYDLPDGKVAEEPVYTVETAQHGDLVAVTRGFIKHTALTQRGECVVTLVIEPAYEDYVLEIAKRPGFTYDIQIRRVRV